MPEISDIKIHAFRGLKDMHLHDCKNFNLLVGENNSGKSSVLEAIYLQDAPLSLHRWREVSFLRQSFGFAITRGLSDLKGLFPFSPDAIESKIGIELIKDGFISPFGATAIEFEADPSEYGDLNVSERVHWLQSKKNGGTMADQVGRLLPGIEVEITGQFEKSLFFWEQGSWPNGRVPKTAELLQPFRPESRYGLSEIEKNGTKPDLIDLLQRIDHDIIDVFLAHADSRWNNSMPDIHVRHRRYGSVPVSYQGRGLSQSLSIALAMATLKPGSTLLIDEVEAGMHTSVLVNVMKWIAEAARERQFQIFATTHSLEAVDAVLAALDNDEDDTAYYKLKGGNVYRRDEESLRASRFKFGHEVR